MPTFTKKVLFGKEKAKIGAVSKFSFREVKMKKQQTEMNKRKL